MTWGTYILRKATLKVQAVTGPDATTEERTERVRQEAGSAAAPPVRL